MASPSSEPGKAAVNCGMCHEKTAIYTCPRCSFRSCSVACAGSHKLTFSCSGERNKAAYVPMNEYGYGAMVNDYSYLEDVSRKASSWGKDIASKGLARGKGSRTLRGRVARGRGRGGFRGAGTSKRESLQIELESRDINVEILPEGMERRKSNQSTWDVRADTALLTMEVTFNPARALKQPPITIITHRNSLKRTLGDMIQTIVLDRRKKVAIPEWVTFTKEDSTMLLVMQQWPAQPPGRAFYVLDGKKSLEENLKDKSFVEFPAIQVFEKADFEGRLVDGVQLTGAPRQRRTLDKKAGGSTSVGLSGLMDYASEDGGSEGEEKEAAGSLLLLDYESDGLPTPPAEALVALLKAAGGSDSDMAGSDWDEEAET